MDTESTAPERIPASGSGSTDPWWGALWYWAPLAVWLGAIFYFSTDVLSSEHTSRFVEPAIRWLLPGASRETVEMFHIVVRKCGHLSEYAMVGLLAFRGVRAGRSVRFRARWAVAAFAIAAVYALTDEFHQTFVPSRTPSPVDVAIDTCGAALGLATRTLARSRLSAGRRSPA
jgi:VanZ family protein